MADWLAWTISSKQAIKWIFLTSKRGGPSLDWLNPALGYAVTNRAQSKIRHWFRKQDREKHLASGRDLLERELKRLGLLDSMTYESVARLFEYDHGSG